MLCAARLRHLDRGRSGEQKISLSTEDILIMDLLSREPPITEMAGNVLYLEVASSIRNSVIAEKAFNHSGCGLFEMAGMMKVSAHIKDSLSSKPRPRWKAFLIQGFLVCSVNPKQLDRFKTILCSGKDDRKMLWPRRSKSPPLPSLSSRRSGYTTRQGRRQTVSRNLGKYKRHSGLTISYDTKRLGRLYIIPHYCPNVSSNNFSWLRYAGSGEKSSPVLSS